MSYDLVIISGYFNPLHVGHLDYIEAAKEMGNQLVAIVNNDKQVELKGSKPFMDEEERLKIVEALWTIDAAIMSLDDGPNVTNTLTELVSMNKESRILFATGADHTRENTKAEADICRLMGIDISYGVGGHKIQSSSKLLENIK